MFDGLFHAGSVNCSPASRLLEFGQECLSDDELLDLLLRGIMACASERHQTVARLVKHFGSASKCITASVKELRRISGLSDEIIIAFKVAHATAMRLAKAQIYNRPILTSSKALHQYLLTAMQHEANEQFRVLYLNSKNHLLLDKKHAEGSVHRVSVEIRTIFITALEVNATAIILAHNHPSGDVTPSNQDIEITRAVVQASRSLSIETHDHIIVGNGRIFSFRKHQLFDSRVLCARDQNWTENDS
ncbi:RadC family protein [Acidisoma sp. C75]